MADYFDTTPNFTNPAYASPEQLKAQRDYAAELIKRSGEPVNRPAGALANMIDALTGSLTRNNAAQIQNQGAQANAQAYAEALRQARGPGGWQSVDPQLIGQLGATPLGSPEQRSFVQHLLQPQNIVSAQGQPGVIAPATGAQAPTLPPNYQVGAPGIRATGDTSYTGIMPPPPVAPSSVPVQPRPAVQPSAKVWGDKEAQAAGLYPPTNASPPAQPGLVGGSFGGYQGTEEQLAALRDFGIRSKYLQEQGKAQTNTMTADIEAANSAPGRLRLFGTMRDEMLKHPEMTMGPTAEFSNNVKRAIANYAPGMLGDKQIQGLAAADSIGKLSTQLASMGAGAGRSDMGLLAGVNSVPHQQNSYQGFLALTEMGMSVENQNLEMRRDLAGIKDPAQYEQARHQWFAQHPIINPITGNPIVQDLAEQKKEGQGGGGLSGLTIEQIRAEKARRQQAR